MGGSAGRVGGVLHQRIRGGVFRVGVEKKDDDDDDGRWRGRAEPTLGVGQERSVEFVRVGDCARHGVFERSRGHLEGWILSGVLTVGVVGDYFGGW